MRLLNDGESDIRTTKSPVTVYRIINSVGPPVVIERPFKNGDFDLTSVPFRNWVSRGGSDQQVLQAEA